MTVHNPVELIPLVTDADGVVRVGNTRVTLDTLIAAHLDGATPERIVEQYPSLELGDVYSVLTYYHRHQEEVENYLRQRQQYAEEVRKENEEQFDPAGVKARLLARRNSQYLPLK